MDSEAIFKKVSEKFADGVSDYTTANTKDPFFKCKPERWLEVAQYLRDEPSLAFDFLQNVTAVDWVKQTKIEMVYHFYSYSLKHSAVVKIDLPRAEPKIASLAGLWKAADWNEREQFDLMGVNFEGHPDLRRIMMPDDWVGHPLRKDYKEQEAYRGMNTTRPNVIDLLPIFDKATPEQRNK